MNVKGIEPSLMLVKEDNKINADTTPLAPKSWTWGNSTKLTIPVVKAVASITNTILEEPYFSSSKGPTIKISIIFPIKCSQPACPKI